MGEKRGMRALEAWCRKVTDGYKGVKIDNMTTSWRDGLAFCAIIHHFRPDLIDFDSLEKDDIYRNNELAFRTAEHDLGIPALLDAEDMVEYEIPDRLSILTYLSQFYQTFCGTQQVSSPARPVPKRPATMTERGVLSSVSESPPSKVAAWVGRREPCAKCGLPVFIAERLIVGGRTLYHRTCFRCARCQHQLSLANCYETEGGQYCCETCPDELLDASSLGKSHVASHNNSADLDMIGHPGPEDEYSADFELALERSTAQTQKFDEPQESKFGKARLDFISSQLVESQERESFCSVSDHEEKKSPVPCRQELPKNSNMCSLSQPSSLPVETNCTSDTGFSSVNVSHRDEDVSLETKSQNSDTAVGSFHSGSDSVKDVPSIKYSVDNDSKQLKTAGVGSKEEESTKELDSTVVPQSSIVKMRLKLFEKSNDVEDNSKISKTRSNREYALYQNDCLRKNQMPAASVESAHKEVYMDEIKIEDKQEKLSGEDDDKKEDVKKLEDVLQTVSSPLTTEPHSLEASEVKVSSDTEDLEGSDIKVTETVVPLPRSEDLVKETSDPAYPQELNPFGNDDEDEPGSQLDVNSSNIEHTDRLNPFNTRDDEVSKLLSPPIPATRVKTLPPPTRKVVEAPKVCLNPFWSDGEEPSSEDEKHPVPLPRTLLSVTPEPSPVPRKSRLHESSGKFGSLSSLSSLSSSAGGSVSHRKKKPAPAPPRSQDLFPTLSRASSPSPSSQGPSPKATPRHRKARPAPPPPSGPSEAGSVTFSEAKLLVSEPGSVQWEEEKSKKDVTNRNRQSQSSSNGGITPEKQLSSGPNKSTYGQWKRKKGPAPPRPVPQRRQIKAIPMQEVKRELDDIEVQQQELERQGVALEKTIRDKFDQSPNREDESSMSPDVEDLVLQLFELVNEKNELFRRQAELMYLRRQQRLEEEHADLEYQIRCLMERPEHTKTDSEKAREEELIQCLVEVVERRNEIIECLEMDRIREAEEDRSIHSRLGMFSKGKILVQEESIKSKSHSGKKQKKKIKKDKEKISAKKVVKEKLDVDKDIDEREEAVSKHIKEKKLKKKWF